MYIACFLYNVPVYHVSYICYVSCIKMLRKLTTVITLMMIIKPINHTEADQIMKSKVYSHTRTLQSNTCFPDTLLLRKQTASLDKEILD